MANYCVPLDDLNYLFWISVGLMLAFVAVAFMIGRALQRRDYEALARDELRQVVISIVIGISVVGLASTACYLSEAMMQNIAPNMTIFQYSENYLTTLVNNIGLPVIKNLWTFSYFSTFLATMNPIQLGGSSPLQGAQIISAAADNINSFVFMPLVSSLTLQMIILQAAEAFSFTLLLPCGMMLRVLRPTRAGGCFLIAVSFAAFVVWPMTYVINYQITQSIYPNFAKGVEVEQMNITELATDPLQIFKFLSEKLLYFVDQGVIVLPQALVLPVFSLTITATFIGAFTEFLKELR